MASQNEKATEDSSFADLQCPMKKRSSCRGYVSDDPQLPKREIAFYLVALVSIITYAGYSFYLTYGVDMAKNLRIDAIKEGWMREYKDGSVELLYEQATTNWKKLLMYSIGFLVVSKVSLAGLPMNVHHLVCTAYTIAMISLVVSTKSALAMLALYAVTLSLAYFSFLAVWIVAGCILFNLNFISVASEVLINLEIDENGVAPFSAIFGYMICRLISFCHEMQIELSSAKEKPTFFAYLRTNIPLTLHYVFYMPYTWCGPILTFKMFRERLALRGTKVTMDSNTAALLAWRICRMLIWYYLLELIYHNLPVGSYLFTLVDDQPIVYKHLAFAMFMQGQNFMLVYIQYYGWPAALALLDGVQLLHWPDCISWVYSYSIMWRVFDRGLFAIMQAHLYLPLGGSKHGNVRHFLSVLASFAFICVFHGDSPNVRAWVTLNVLQLLTERAVSSVYSNHLRSIVTKYLSPQNEKRLVGYFIAWNMMASCGIIFFFLGGMNGFIIFPEFLHLRSLSRHTPLWHMLTMQFAAYCAVQIGRYYEVKFRSKVTKSQKSE